MSTHHDCEHGKAYWQDCKECKAASVSNSTVMPGYVAEDGEDVWEEYHNAMKHLDSLGVSRNGLKGEKLTLFSRINKAFSMLDT